MRTAIPVRAVRSGCPTTEDEEGTACVSLLAHRARARSGPVGQNWPVSGLEKLADHVGADAGASAGFSGLGRWHLPGELGAWRRVCQALIDSRRKRERVWAGLYLHHFLVKIVSTATHARYLTIATSVASLFRRVEPACNTEMH